MREDTSKLFPVLMVAIIALGAVFYVYHSTSSGQVSFGSNAQTDFFGRVIDVIEINSTTNNSLGTGGGSGGSGSNPTPTKYQPLIVSEDGEYFVKMLWFNSAARVNLEVYKPTQITIGSFLGYYPEMPEEISLGKLTAGTEIVFTHNSLWYDKKPGPFYSTDSSIYTLEKLSSNKWQLTFDDGLYLGTLDGQFIVYKKNSSVNVPICGNNQLDAGEQCDGSAMAASISCNSFGYIGGYLSCDSNCKFDFSTCIKNTTINNTINKTVDFSKYLILGRIGNYTNKTPDTRSTQELGYKYALYEVEYDNIDFNFFSFITGTIKSSFFQVLNKENEYKEGNQVVLWEKSDAYKFDINNIEIQTKIANKIKTANELYQKKRNR